MFKTVLVPVDVSLPAEAAKVLGAAKRLVAPWDCTVHAVTIVPDMGMAIVGSYFSKGFEAGSLEQAGAELRTAVEAAGIKAELHVLAGTVYDRVLALANKVQEARIAAQDETGEVRLASRASVPTAPAGPRKMMNTVVAGFLGLFLGTFVALFVDYWRTQRDAPAAGV